MWEILGHILNDMLDTVDNLQVSRLYTKKGEFKVAKVHLFLLNIKEGISNWMDVEEQEAPLCVLVLPASFLGCLLRPRQCCCTLAQQQASQNEQ